MENIKFRVAEKTTYGGEKWFVPQIKEKNKWSADAEEDWNDIDFDGEEYSTVVEDNGDLKCNSFDEAMKVIKMYIKEKEEELKDEIKETIYHGVNL